jgi:hypothetical protein
VHTLRVPDQAKQIAYSGLSLSASCCQGDHSGARDPNQRRNHAPQAESNYLKTTCP